MYDFMLYRLPLIMVIASAGRNIALGCLQENKACQHCTATYFLFFFIIIISTSDSFTCHDLPVSVVIRFRRRESLFLDDNHNRQRQSYCNRNCLQETIII